MGSNLSLIKYMVFVLSADDNGEVSGTIQPSKAGANILLDLLSIRSPNPGQNGSMNGDLLSIHDNNSPVVTIDTISSTSPTAPSSMMDVLDGFGPTPPKSEDKGPTNPSIVAFESSTLKIEFNFTKKPENPQATYIVANPQILLLTCTQIFFSRLQFQRRMRNAFGIFIT